jgi:hypothetical protein
MIYTAATGMHAEMYAILARLNVRYACSMLAEMYGMCAR